MGNYHHKRIRHKNRKVNKVGERPGTISIPADALKPRIVVYSYNQTDLQVSEGTDMRTITEQLKRCTDHTHWIRVNGIGDAQLMEDIGTFLGINQLVLEDIVNTHQRPKFDEYDNYAFGTSRIIYLNDENELINCQFSGIIKENLLMSFEESYDDYFSAVITRIKAGKGLIRVGGSGYLFYALTDTILDNYFVVLSDLGDQVEETEERVYKSPSKSIMFDAQQLKRTFITIRRACWPERDKINDMIRSESPLINNDTKIYLRDAYDHCIQAMEIVESYKEVTGSVIDLYLSMVSNRMNEIMKVLTIISVIFIPLTFVAGIYGMNFSRQDTHGRIIPDNMPELYVQHGYVYTIIAMLFIALVQLLVFWRKGWFNKL
ncbi:magnesium/cobalt transporter CorA [Mucilaginibacter pallidiroseus]|uniref:Magnesium transport protein CorA n=1 Tax=Mucilaginibacter pallidiroseus TaxID=2599295 RepID=A0A563UI70_9SPHI|nr:magnesium/cobalt transporter CorA [Mucilaginibacter pallidiroseus]TWR31100.1 magnesium/cobalt transporter CorA [Mucilaginibacter pallidiroseus]